MHTKGWFLACGLSVFSTKMIGSDLEMQIKMFLQHRQQRLVYQLEKQATQVGLTAGWQSLGGVSEEGTSERWMRKDGKK